MEVIAFAKLNIEVPKLNAVETLESNSWLPHFNTNDYEGDWEVLPLRSPGGRTDTGVPDLMGDSGYIDTVYMQNYPGVKQLLDSIKCPILSVRFLNLKPGSVIKEHRDAGLAFEMGEARLHFPVLTNNEVEFFSNNVRLNMLPGDCWYINANLPHRVANYGNTDRIHLVVDCQVNDWLKLVFEKGEKEFFTDDKVPVDNSLAMIEALRLMNTETSLRIADELELKLKEKSIANNLNTLYSYLPYKLKLEDGEMLCHWLNAKDHTFTEPFFHETISKIKGSSRGQMLNSVSDLEMLKAWEKDTDAIAPTAFIFHVSRCGSTLLTQLLSTDEQNIVLSEVPFFDEVLRAPYQPTGISKQEAGVLLKAALKFYGQKRTGNEKQLYIKLDSWHINFYQELRVLFPDVPFIMLYRKPNEVLDSHRKLRGMQAVPTVIEPEIFGFTEEDWTTNNFDVYLAKVLERYFDKFLEAAAHDPLSMLLNYNEGSMPMVERIAAFTGIGFNDRQLADMQERSKFHSKFPGQVFNEERGQEIPPYLTKVMNLYERVEEKRLVVRVDD
ncbi:aspartyl/asparaginyl beta-hydroxylase domain-containing protein [Mucilaginibacter jinjuensis]|uniref:Aspartyl/asparaginyl beta-hydroxylase domain-containing protein n=1 Tax=Mucilaginibacter jinjuensis TaxID=1176721 RepID=A0ABY7T273_9SPHI|nr:aspartyl/asparaginyl beta-hydroxylase domain-containing protein [Mucilaginibacter jinjuensis]WCT10348.1 aspartyl/asparaginyl beta-hydroxylase domain-containing protein [Mucilaginibacter jinjuensis]